MDVQYKFDVAACLITTKRRESRLRVTKWEFKQMHLLSIVIAETAVYGK